MEDNILEKLEEKLRSILSLRIKIALSENFKEFSKNFENDYILSKLEELILDVDDAVEVAIEDIKMEIETDIELDAQAEYEDKELEEFEYTPEDESWTKTDDPPDEPWMS